MEAILGLVVIILIISYLIQTGSFAGILAVVLLIVMLVFAMRFFKTPPKQQEKPSDPETKPISLSSEPPLDIAKKADEFVTRGVPLDAVANFRDGYVTAEEIERCILSGDFKVASSSFGGNPHLIHSQERERRKARRFYPQFYPSVQIDKRIDCSDAQDDKDLSERISLKPNQQMSLEQAVAMRRQSHEQPKDIMFTDVFSHSSEHAKKEPETTNLPNVPQSDFHSKPRATKSIRMQRNTMSLSSELQEVKGRLEANQKVAEYPLQAKEVPWSLEVTQSRLLRIRTHPDKKQNDMNEYTQNSTHGEQFSEVYINKPEEYNRADCTSYLDSMATPKTYTQESVQVLCSEVENCSETISKV